jgi:hypothetical protein
VKNRWVHQYVTVYYIKWKKKIVISEAAHSLQELG